MEKSMGYTGIKKTIQIKGEDEYQDVNLIVEMENLTDDRYEEILKEMSRCARTIEKILRQPSAG